MSEQQALTRDEISAKIALRAWQDEDFRTRVLSNANAVFEEEFKEKLPSGVNLKVIEDDAKTVHFVIPAKPSNTEDLSDEELEAVAGGASPAVAATIMATVAVAGVAIPVIRDIIKSSPKPRW